RRPWLCVRIAPTASPSCSRRPRSGWRRCSSTAPPVGAPGTRIARTASPSCGSGRRGRLTSSPPDLVRVAKAPPPAALPAGALLLGAAWGRCDRLLTEAEPGANEQAGQRYGGSSRDENGQHRVAV